MSTDTLFPMGDAESPPTLTPNAPQNGAGPPAVSEIVTRKAAEALQGLHGTGMPCILVIPHGLGPHQVRNASLLRVKGRPGCYVVILDPHRPERRRLKTLAKPRPLPKALVLLHELLEVAKEGFECEEVIPPSETEAQSVRTGRIVGGTFDNGDAWFSGQGCECTIFAVDSQIYAMHEPDTGLDGLREYHSRDVPKSAMVIHADAQSSKLVAYVISPSDRMIPEYGTVEAQLFTDHFSSSASGSEGDGNGQNGSTVES